MATIAAPADVRGEAPGFALPYPPGWANLLIDWIDGLPGPSRVFYLGAMALGAALSQSILWIPGTLAVGQLNSTQVYCGTPHPTPAICPGPMYSTRCWPA